MRMTMIVVAVVVVAGVGVAVRVVVADVIVLRVATIAAAMVFKVVVRAGRSRYRLIRTCRGPPRNRRRRAQALWCRFMLSRHASR